MKNSFSSSYMADNNKKIIDNNKIKDTKSNANNQLSNTNSNN